MGGGVGFRRVAWGAALTACSLLWPGPGPWAGQDAAGQRPSPSLLSADAAAFKRVVRRAPEPEGLRIFYEWRDGRGSDRLVDVPMDESALADSERSFGFSVAELESFLRETEARIREDMGLTAAAIGRKAVAASPDPTVCRVEADAANDFQFVLKSDGAGRADHAAEIDAVVRAAQKAWASSRKRVGARLEAEMEAFIRSRGMILAPEGIAADHRAIVRENRARLAPLAAEFKRLCGSDRKALLEALLSFVQSIPSRSRLPVEDGKYTAGLAVPLRVLADDSGDCDSKAVLFASLWTSLCRYRTILVMVREHMLVGIALPFAAGATVEFDGLRYVLLEVNCGGSLLPGEVTAYSFDALQKGQFKYRIVS